MTCDRFKCRVGLLLMDRRSRWEIAQGSASSNRGSKRFKEGKLATRILRMTQKISPLAEMNYSRSQDWIPRDLLWSIFHGCDVWGRSVVIGLFALGFWKWVDRWAPIGQGETEGDIFEPFVNFLFFANKKTKTNHWTRLRLPIQNGKMHWSCKTVLWWPLHSAQASS